MFGGQTLRPAATPQVWRAGVDGLLHAVADPATPGAPYYGACGKRFLLSPMALERPLCFDCLDVVGITVSGPGGGVEQPKAKG